MGTCWEIALDILLPRACAHCREDLLKNVCPNDVYAWLDCQILRLTKYNLSVIL